MSAVVFENLDIVFGDRQARRARADRPGQDARRNPRSRPAPCSARPASTSPIEQGEICVLMGLSGSGKSTILRAVNGLNKVARGKVLVEHDGGAIDVASCSADELRALRTQPHRHGVPAIRAAAVAHGARRMSASASNCAAPEGGDRPHRRRKARDGRPVAMGGQVRPRTVGRHAAARRPRARLRHRRRHLADGRAVLGARPADPRQVAGRVAACCRRI